MSNSDEEAISKIMNYFAQEPAASAPVPAPASEPTPAPAAAGREAGAGRRACQGQAAATARGHGCGEGATASHAALQTAFAAAAGRGARAPPPPPPPPPPLILNKRSIEVNANDKIEPDKRIKVEPVAQDALIAPEKPSVRTFAIKFSNNQKVIYFWDIQITTNIQQNFISYLKHGISVFINDKYNLNEAFDKAFDNTIKFLDFHNITFTVLIIGTNTNSGIITDTKGFLITLDFFGGNQALFVNYFDEMTNIDTFEKLVISEIKKVTAEHACAFAKNTLYFAKFAEAEAKFAETEAIKAKSDFDTAQKNITKAKSDLDTAQNTITEAKSVFKTAQTQENTIEAITIKAITLMDSGIDTLRERLDAAQKRFNAAQADVITAEKRFDAAQADVTLTKNSVSNAAKDSKKKTEDAEAAQNNTKDIKKVNLKLMDRYIIFKSE